MDMVEDAGYTIIQAAEIINWCSQKRVALEAETIEQAAKELGYKD